MATAENAKLQYEAGQTFTDFMALTNDGDNKTFTSGADLWSGKEGYDVDVRPNGLITGGNVTPGSSNDTVDVAALTCYLAGAKTSVSASSGFSVTRPSTDVAKINSITINSSGTITEVTGTDGTDQTFSETRGADGGPPWIPTDSIEIAQVRITTSASAVLTESQIKQVVGTHRERYDSPVWDLDYFNAQVEFISALPEIHSDDSGSTKKTKAVYAAYYEPDFADIAKSANFVPPENSHSVNSTQIYGMTLGSTSSSLGQGSFTAYLRDGVSDNLIKEKDSTLFFKFFPDRLKTEYIICQGKLGIARSFPAGDEIQAECTISAQAEGQEVTS